jgi:RNA polymerase sigma factor (sigma-70 family)
MSPPPDEFAALMGRVQAGCQEAARTLVERFGRHLLHVVRRRLSRRLRPRFDPADFTQIVWLEFFTRAVRANTFDRPEQVLAFLAHLARKRLIDAHRKHLDTQKHDLARQVPLDEADGGGHGRPVAPGPDPAAVAAARVDDERRLADFPEPQRRLLVLLLQGRAFAEVAVALGLGARTIRRRLDVIRGQSRLAAACA